MFCAAPVILPLACDVRRQITRPAEQRQRGFEQAFDGRSLFHDAIALEKDGASTMVLVGPPLRNLLPLFVAGVLGGRDVAVWMTRYLARDRCSDVWGPARGEPVRLELTIGSFDVQPSAARHELYEGRRVLYTLSRDNEVRWIADWARFHIANHGADALLFYDNGSTIYGPAELEQALRAALPELVVHVVNWPFPYGPGGWSATVGWDSDFTQATAFHDARLRFLQRAASVLNCDVDELVVSPAGQSVFECTEARESGYLAFHGQWVSAARPAEEVGRQPSRHGDFAYLEHGAANCPTKWCVVPSRCRFEDQWRTHDVIGKLRASADERFVYRHFRAVSTDWKYPRTTPAVVDPARHILDRELLEALTRAGLPHGERAAAA